MIKLAPLYFETRYPSSRIDPTRCGMTIKIIRAVAMPFELCAALKIQTSILALAIITFRGALKSIVRRAIIITIAVIRALNRRD